MQKVLMTVFGLMCAGALTAQWNPQANLQVAPAGIASEEFEFQINKDGVTFVAFWKHIPETPERLGTRHSDVVDYAYYLQIIDKDGYKLLPDEGLLISDQPTRSFMMGAVKTIFTDSDGNALYVVKDERNATSDEQGFFVYKISPTGQMLWTNPLDLDRGVAQVAVYNLDIIELADGSYIIAHDIEVAGGRIYIAIDKVSKAGVFEWGGTFAPERRRDLCLPVSDAG
jgi:hypothetical protein